MNTGSWIKYILEETESALSLYYSHLAFNEALKDKIANDSAHKNGRFWLVHNGAIWRTLFLYLGRLSDDSKEAKSFAVFQKHCFKNIGDFSRSSFLMRRSEAISLNPRFLDNSEFPCETTFKNLFSLVSEHNAFLRAECKTIRSKVYAHAIYTEEHEFNQLFSSVKYSEIEAALLAYWSVAIHLRESFDNAKTINPSILEYYEKKHIYSSTLRVLKGEN